MTNKHNAVFYTGVSSDLLDRVYKHKTKADPQSFTAKYNTNKLVYYEVFEDITEAIQREKQIKGGSRNGKMKLIESMNPEYKDLYEDIIK